MKTRNAFTAWLASHLGRSSAAKLLALVLVLLMVGVAAAILAPVSDVLRVLLISTGGLGIVSASGLYLAYRTTNFARRTSAENAVIKALLAEVVEGLARSERDRRYDLSNFDNDIRNQVGALERKIGAELMGRDQRIALVDASVRENVRLLEATLMSIQGAIERLTLGADATNIRMAAATSSIERLQVSSRSEMTAVVNGLQLQSAQAQQRLDSLELKLDGAVREAAVANNSIADVAAAQAKIEKQLEVVPTDKGADRSVVMQIQRELCLLAEICASSQDRTGFLAEQVADVQSRARDLQDIQAEIRRDVADTSAELLSRFDVVDGQLLAQASSVVSLENAVHVRQSHFERSLDTVSAQIQSHAAEFVSVKGLLDTVQADLQRGLSFAATDAAAALQKSVLWDEQVRQAIETVRDDSERRHGVLIEELQHLRGMGQRAVVFDEAIASLEEGRQSLHAELVELKRDVTHSLINMDRSREVQAGLEVETSRLAAASNRIAVRQEGLVELVEKTRNDLSRVAATADDSATRLAVLVKQANEMAFDLSGFSRVAAENVEKLRERIESVGNNADAATLTNQQLQLDFVASRNAQGELAEALGTQAAWIAELQSGHSESTLVISGRLDAIAADLSNTKAVYDERAAENLARFSALDATIQSGVAAPAARIAELQAAHSESTLAISGRLDAIAADLTSTKAAYAEGLAEAGARLSALDARVDSGASVRFAAIESEISQIVRMVEDAETAFASEASRVSGSVAKLTDDIQSIGKAVESVPAAFDAKLGALERSCSETIKKDVEERLSEVGRQIAQVTQLLNDSEVATVSELTYLSATTLQLKDDIEKLGEARNAKVGDDIASAEPLRVRLSKAASQLEVAVRETELALSHLSVGNGGGNALAKATQAAADRRGKASKSTAAKSSGSKAAKTRKRR